LSNKKVVLDTNMLLAIPKLKVDVFAGITKKMHEAKFFVAGSVLAELEKIGNESRKRRGEVDIVMEEIGRNNTKELSAGRGNADDDLLELASRGFYVASNDRALRKKIKMLGGKNIYIRASKFIEIE